MFCFLVVNQKEVHQENMLGILFNDKECREFDYVLRKELDEMLLDLNDSRMDGEIKKSNCKQVQGNFPYVCAYCFA